MSDQKAAAGWMARARRIVRKHVFPPGPKSKELARSIAEALMLANAEGVRWGLETALTPTLRKKKP